MEASAWVVVPSVAPASWSGAPSGSSGRPESSCGAGAHGFAPSTHAPLHTVLPGGHAHTPSLQVAPVTHTSPQPPQLPGSVQVSPQLSIPQPLATVGLVELGPVADEEHPPGAASAHASTNVEAQMRIAELSPTDKATATPPECDYLRPVHARV